MIKVVISKKARKFLLKLDKKSYLLIAKKIHQLTDTQKHENLNLKPLKGKYASMWRLRVGSRRVLFTRDDKAREIKIWLIEDRGDIY